MFRLPAETAHEAGMAALRLGLAGVFQREFEGAEFGGVKRFGLEFKNPLGMAAGFDKNGLAVNQLAALGFGFVEVGTVTFRPQPGNEKPRLFRVPADRALINRLGFNNEGAERIASRLSALNSRCVLGVNIGKNKDVANEAAIENYLATFELIHPVADYIAVNVSSPNTPNLRELQSAENLDSLLAALQKRNAELFETRAGRSHDSRRDAGATMKPLLVKIAPDLSEAALESIVNICLTHKIAGVIATNTTVGRDNLTTPENTIAKIGAGGLSGAPLNKRSTEVISALYRHSRGGLPIIGVGGIFTAADAFAKIAAGASLLQAYTGFIYQGPALAYEINSGLAKILKERGFRSLDEAVGSGH
jgi:dihydroorotate dehydrogenase